MTLKRGRLIVFACLVAIAVMLIIGRCMPTEVSADPVGPPTIETHLTNISANMDTIKLMGKVLLGAGALISTLLGFIFMSLRERVKKTEDDVDHIQEFFLSIKSFELWKGSQ